VGTLGMGLSQVAQVELLVINKNNSAFGAKMVHG
jgi:hypothetical protein